MAAAFGASLVNPPVLRIHRSMFKALALYNQDRLGWMEKAASTAPVVRLPFGPVTLIVVSDPDAARSILMTDSQRWRRPPATMMPARLAAGDNLFTQADRQWAGVQPALAPDFRKRALEPRLAEIGALVKKEVDSVPLSTSVDLDRVLGRIAMIVASWVLFGQHLSKARADELVASQRVLVDWVGKRIGSLRAFLPLALGRSAIAMRRHRDVLYAFADEVVARRRHEGHPQADVLQALLDARPGGRPLTDVQIRSHVAGLFAAGNETTAATMAWAIVYGAEHPQEWAALRSDPSAVEPFVNETLRLRPQAWGIPRSPRRLTNAVTVGDTQYLVRPHHGLVINIWGMNRIPSLWPNPDSFHPVRQRTFTRAQERASFPFTLRVRGGLKGKFTAPGVQHVRAAGSSNPGRSRSL